MTQYVAKTLKEIILEELLGISPHVESKLRKVIEELALPDFLHTRTRNLPEYVQNILTNNYLPAYGAPSFDAPDCEEEGYIPQIRPLKTRPF